MNIRILSLALCAACLCPAMAVHAQTGATQSGPTVEGARAVVATARLTGKITHIDAAKRIVTIRNAQGETHDFALDERVKNFDQIAVGDNVTLDYRQAIVLALEKGGDGLREKREHEAATSAPLGAKPAGAVERSVTLVSNVVAVDQKGHSVTLKTPEGRIVKAKVEDPAVLSTIKKGDQVVATIYESVAVAFTPAKAGK
ncbi:MAG: hypothetical protein QM639_13630 [Rhodocyclaceae bacterium]